MYLYTRPQCKAGFLLLYRYYFSCYLGFISSLVISSYFLYLNVNVPERNTVYYLTLLL